MASRALDALTRRRDAVEKLRANATKFLASKRTTPMMKQYWEAKRSYPDHLLLFRMGDFYESFYEDAEKVSSLLRITLTSRNQKSTASSSAKDSIPMCGIPHHAVDRHLNKLMYSGMRVAICDQQKDLKQPVETIKSSDKKKSKNAMKKDPSATTAMNPPSFSSSAVLPRSVSRLLTPGTILEENFLRPNEHNFIMAIARAKERDSGVEQFGLARLDLSTGELFLSPLGGENGLKSRLARFTASELVVPQALVSLDDLFEPDESRMQQYRLVNELMCPTLGNCLVSFQEDETFENPSSHADDGMSMLMSFIDDGWSLASLAATSSPEITSFTQAEMSAAVGLMRYIRYTQCGQDLYFANPQRLDFGANSEFLSIDPPALKSLEIVKTINGLKRGSLLYTIDRTQTSAGARLLSDRIQTPLKRADLIELRLNGVEFLLKRPVALKTTTDLLRSCRDLTRCIQRISLNRGGPLDLACVAQTTKQAILIAKELRQLAKEENDPEAVQLFRHSELGQVCQRILCLPQDVHDVLNDLCLALVEDSGPGLESGKTENNLGEEQDDQDTGAEDDEEEGDEYASEEQSLSSHGQGSSTVLNIQILPGYCKELDEYRNVQENRRGVLRELEVDLRKRTNVKTLRIRMNKFHGYFVEIPSNKAQALDPKQFFRLKELKSTTRFKTPELINTEAKMAQAMERITRLETEILNELYASVLDVEDHLSQTAHDLAVIDVTASLARIADEMNLTRPQLVHDCSLDIVDGRHIVIENQHQSNRSDKRSNFVPNNLQLCGGEVLSPSHSSCWLITGPNMGGKSTFLRQCAQIILLAQAGSFVPASRAVVGLVDQIFCRVGASDELVADRSTFMVEMEETATILNKATERSFVVVDEVGRGTSTRDGLAIAQAVLERLMEIRCRTLFATHFHELGACADKQGAACYQTAVQVLENEDQVAFMFKLVPGLASHSYGIYVARLANVPESVLTRAKELLEDQDSIAEREQIRHKMVN